MFERERTFEAELLGEKVQTAEIVLRITDTVGELRIEGVCVSQWDTLGLGEVLIVDVDETVTVGDDEDECVFVELAVVDKVLLEVTQAVFETVAVRVLFADGLTCDPDGLNERRIEGDTVLLIEKLADGLTLGVDVAIGVGDIDCPALADTEIQLVVDCDKIELALKEDDEESVNVGEGDIETAGDEDIDGLREFKT